VSSPEAVRRVLLVGFMGAGKSSVGLALARELSWEFVDFDAVIEQRAGTSIPRIFAEEGEEVFRAREAQVGQELLLLERTVLSAGGGWPVPKGRLEGIPTGTLSVWLQVTPETALRRSTVEPGARPMLDHPAPLARARTLLQDRTPRYALAHLALDTEDESPQRLARRIADLVRAEPTS